MFHFWSRGLVIMCIYIHTYKLKWKKVLLFLSIINIWCQNMEKIALLNFLKLCTIWEAKNWDFFLPGFDWMTLHFVEYMIVGRFLDISETRVYILYKSVNIYKSNVLWWGRSFSYQKVNFTRHLSLHPSPTTLSSTQRMCVPYDTSLTIIISSPLLDRREAKPW